MSSSNQRKQAKRRLMEVAIVASSMTLAPAGAQAAGSDESDASKAPRPRQTEPVRGWAHRDGVAHLKPLDQTGNAGSVFDRQLIQEAYGRWGIAYDEARVDVVDSLFTDDAVFQVAKGSGAAFVNASGRKAVLATIGSALAQQHDQRRHAISNITFERLTATQADTLAYGIVTVAADGLSIGATVLYAGTLRKGADGRWRFSKLFIGMDDYAGAAPKVSPAPPTAPPSTTP